MVLELDWQVHKTTEIAVIAIGNGASIVADGIRKQCDNCVMQITSTGDEIGQTRLILDGRGRVGSSPVRVANDFSLLI